MGKAEKVLGEMITENFADLKRHKPTDSKSEKQNKITEIQVKTHYY